jgi:hypothetical protein
MDERMKDIHLLLIYLSGFGSYEDSTKVRGKKVFRAWKGYLFDILNELERENLIIQYRKSMILTEKGIAKAKGLKEKYL